MQIQADLSLYALKDYSDGDGWDWLLKVRNFSPKIEDASSHIIRHLDTHDNLSPDAMKQFLDDYNWILRSDS